MIRIAATLWCCSLAAIAAQPGESRVTDEQSVRAVVQRYVDARERRDAAALAALFTEDADQFTTSGEWRKGREAIVKGGLASSSRNPGTRSIAVETVRFVAPGVAIADGGYSISAGTEGTTRAMWTTLVLTRTPDGWRIAAIRNALPQARELRGRPALR